MPSADQSEGLAKSNSKLGGELLSSLVECVTHPEAGGLKGIKQWRQPWYVSQAFGCDEDAQSSGGAQAPGLSNPSSASFIDEEQIRLHANRESRSKCPI